VAAPIESQATDEFSDTPTMTVRPRGGDPRRIFLLPMPRADYLCFGADPVDGLPELQNVRDGVRRRDDDRPGSGARCSACANREAVATSTTTVSLDIESCAGS